MSQNWKRNRWGKFKPQMEQLESRETPAGNITVGVFGGVLTIRSDDGSHAFNISGTGQRSVAIRPDPGCTINGLAQDVVFVGGVTRGFDIQLGNGNDSVVFSGVDGRDYISINTGGGDDFVHMVNGTNSRHSTWVVTGDGNDVIIINGSTFREHLAIEAGAGNDIVDLGPSNDFGGGLTFQGDVGVDTLALFNNRFQSAPLIAGFELRPPTVNPLTGNDSATVLQKGSTTINVLANDAAVIGALNPGSVTVTGNPTSGTAVVNADGTISYTNNGSSSTTDSFRYTVANTFGGTSSEATVFINVTITDNTAPTATLSSSSSDPTNTTPIPYTLNFSEAVTGFTQSDITVTGGTASAVTTVSAQQYTFTVTPTANGTVTVSIPAGAANDSAGNGNSASNTISRVFDTMAPTVTANPLTTNDTTPTLTGTVSESNATVTVTVNGQTANATVSGNTWTATLATALADGTYAIAVNATDAAGNTGSTTLADGLVIDTVAPIPTISSTETDPTTTSPIPITVTFNESVSGFAADLVTITNGTVSNFVSIDSKVYTFDVMPTATGLVTVNVAAGVVTDTAGNPNAAATEFSITFTGITVALASTSSDPTNVSPIPYTAVFSEDVTGFDIDDITVSNGTVTAFNAIDGSSYTFEVTPAGEGTVSVNIEAGSATGVGGNGNLASPIVTRVFDSIAPTVTADALTTNSTTPTLTGTVDDSTATVVVTVDGVMTTATVTGNAWSAIITTPLADGTYDITVTATDAAGNVGTTTLTDGLVIDATAPTATTTSTASDPTTTSPIPVTVTFSEAVTGFAVDQVTISNGTASNFVAVDAMVYTFDVTPTALGLITVNVPANVAMDAAGNGNTAAPEFSITFNGIMVTVASTSADPTNVSPIPFTATFTEDVTGFDVSDIVVSNGTAGDFVMVDGSNYTFTVTPTADGTVSVIIPADAATGTGGNGNLASVEVTRVFDSTAPVVTADPLTTNSTTPTLTGTVDDPTATVVVTVNGEMVNATVTGTTWSATLTTPLADGTYDITVTATDAAGNMGTTTLTDGLVVDATAPTVAIASTATDPTTASPIPITVTFDEAVTGFTDAGVTITNGTIANFVAVDAMVYTFDVTPTALGVVTVNVPANVATDAAGNGNTAAPEFSITFNGIFVTLASTAGDPTNLNPIPFTATFTEDVTGFDASGITATNGTVGDFVMVDGANYTFTVTPTADGTVSVMIPANVATGTGGNGNLASPTVSRVYDSIAPIVTADALTTNNASPTLTGTVDDTNATVVVTVGTETETATVTGNTWSVTLLMVFTDGSYDIMVTATDAAGNVGMATLTDGLVIDTTAAIPTISSAAADPTTDSPIPFTVTFDEAVNGFSAAGVNVVNGTVSNFVAVDSMVYTFNVTPAALGLVTINVPASVATDAAGNDNAAATEFSITFSGIIVTVDSTTAAITNVNPIPFTATFTEDVTGFDDTDIIVTNGTVGDFVAVDGSNYTFTVTPAGEGDVTVMIPAGAGSGTGGNGNIAGVTVTRTFDSIVPVVTADPLTTNNSTPTLTGTVDDESAAVVVTVNGESVDATVVGTTWTATLTIPLADGTYDITVSATDAAGNVGNDTQVGGLVIDATGPVPTISSAETDPTMASPFTVTVTFDEDVTGFTAAGVTVMNGTISNFLAVDAMVYTFDVTPTAQAVITVNVAAGVATDSFGNTNTAATEFSITFNGNVQPSVTLTSTSTDPTRFSPIPIVATFSEDVTGFDVTDISVSGGTAGNFVAVDAQTYTFDVTPVGNGTIRVMIAANVAVDGDGAGNTASLELNRTFDTIAPTTTINPLTTNNPMPTITGTVSEPGAMVEISANAIVVQAVVTGTTWTATFTTPFADGTYNITSVTTDAAGNQTPQILPSGLVIDTVPPQVFLSTTATNPTMAAAIPVSVVFDSIIVGFDESDIVVTNGTIADFTMLADNEFSFNVIPTADGPITVMVPAGVATDEAGNGNLASTTLNIVSDRTSPSVTLGYTGDNPTSATTLAITATFDEDVTGFTIDDITVTNGTASNFVAIDARNYTFDVTPTGDGTVDISIAADVALDAAENGNTPSNTLSIVADQIAPSGTINVTGSTAITGTAVDTQSGVASVSVSILDNMGNYWDGAGFNSATEIFLTATSLDNFATWAYDFNVAGVYTVTARITDVVGLTTDIASLVTITP